jgi:hypothetical protein
MGVCGGWMDAWILPPSLEILPLCATSDSKWNKTKHRKRQTLQLMKDNELTHNKILNIVSDCEAPVRSSLLGIARYLGIYAVIGRKIIQHRIAWTRNICALSPEDLKHIDSTQLLGI